VPSGVRTPSGDRNLSGPFRRFVAAATISLYGDQLTTVALLVLLYQVTGSIQAPAAYLLAKQLPRLIGLPAGGELADRFSPQMVVAVCSLGQAATIGGIVLAGDHGSAWVIYLLVVVGQLGAGMARAATGAVMPRVVPPERLSRANALLQLFQNSTFVGGPLLGAPLLAWKGPDALLLVDLGTFLVAAALMAGLPTLIQATASMAAGPLSGLRTVLGDPLLRVLALAFMAEGIVVNVAASVFVLLATERLGGNGYVALLYGFVGIGDALGGLLVLRARPGRVSPFVVLLPALISVGAIGFLVFAHAVWSAALPLILCGGGAVVFQTWGMAEAQRVTSRDVMGRVSAVIYLAQGVGLMIGAATQIILLGFVRWDVALGAVSAATVVALAIGGGIGGRSRATTTVQRSATT
jgi:MFS family permease